MVRELKIFLPNCSYRPDTGQIILGALAFNCLAVYLIKVFCRPNSEFLEAIFAFLIVLTLAYAIILVFANLFRHEPLRGKFVGSLIADRDYIRFGNTVYKLADIEHMEILAHDIKGNMAWTLWEFKPNRANGTGNYVKLYLKDGSTAQCHFLQTQSETIRIFKDELTEYYRFGYLTRDNYRAITKGY